MVLFRPFFGSRIRRCAAFLLVFTYYFFFAYWAREGAIVTGIDFSEPAIEAAQSRAREVGIEARFITSDIYALPDVLEEQFDIVVSAYGTLNWLPDLKRWADVVAPLVRPGGRSIS